MSAGSGPRASMPSARSCSTAGATTLRSSSPSAPSSPACGLSPASASRGRAMPKRSFRSRATMRPVSTIRSVVSWRRHLAHRQVDRHRHDGELVRPQHHHGMPCAPGMLLRELGEEFRVARLGKAGAVKHRLGDRVGDDGMRAPREHVVDRAADRGDGGWCARGIGRAGLCGHAFGESNDWQRSREGLRRILGSEHAQRDLQSDAGARARATKSGSARR